MTVQHPDDDRMSGRPGGGTGDEAGEQTDDLSDELQGLAVEESGLPSEPWPVPDDTAAGAPFRLRLDHPDDFEAGAGFDTRAVLKVALLIGLLGVVTFLAIVVGRALKPSSSTVATTASVPVTTTAHRPRRARARPPAVVRWGPLAARVVGRFAPAARASVAVAGSKLVVAGGTGSDRVLIGPVGGRLRRAGKLPGKRAAAAAFTFGGSVYLLGGENGAIATDQIVRIDPESGRTVSAGTFEEPLAEAAVGVSGGSVYLVGGWTGQKYATAILRFTPGGAPSLVARLPQGVRAPAMAIVGHRLILAGGLTEQGVSRQVYAIDLASGGVKALGALPQGLERSALVAVGSRLYLFGGLGADRAPVATVVRIDPSSGKATAVGTMPQPLADAAAVAAGSAALLVDTRRGVVYRLG